MPLLGRAPRQACNFAWGTHRVERVRERSHGATAREFPQPAWHRTGHMDPNQTELLTGLRHNLRHPSLAIPGTDEDENGPRGPDAAPSTLAARGCGGSGGTVTSCRTISPSAGPARLHVARPLARLLNHLAAVRRERATRGGGR